MKFSDIPQFTREGQWECSYSIDRLIRQIEEFENEEGLDMNPDFQRGHVWTEKQQIKYIEFILKGGKTGRVIYLNHPNWMGSFEPTDIGFVCVDGLQRVTAIRRFVNNEFKVLGHYFNEFEGSTRVLQNMRINVNNLKTREEVLQWYLEMNEGGTPHTKEELDKVKNMLKELKVRK
ncbi:DUF262 domain-containing protein [Alkaliphilus sp. B6464]|uniref:DUF262 domain-containing protein n=1 Tax=Alkaliphilus sp. B6464 TaxID=2731219 RepID=UPI001BADCECC|nr:DUF262 domain-containing protein [Alkaliphilus sp. B6464]QUH21803.1 DUF262 domain-containing protein [Alkaliphilus sp. B6464]